MGLRRLPPFVALAASGAASGVLLSFAYPPVGWWPLSAVALMPFFLLLILLRHKLTWRLVWLAAFVLGVAWHLSSVWWVGYVTVAGMLALVMIVAILLASSLTLCWWLVRSGLHPFIALTAGWMVFEALVTYVMTGFPWLLLGYTWRPWLTMIQVADIAGVYAVSMLVVLINAAFAQSCAGMIERWSFVRRQAGVLVMVVLYGSYCAYGTWRLVRLGTAQPERAITLACVQANIPSLVKHDVTKDSEVLARHCGMSFDAARKKPDVIVWSETAVPGYFNERMLSFHAITNLVGSTGIPLLTGLPWFELDKRGEPLYYNSAGIIETNGTLACRYDKMHLVMFGEYVPYERLLPFLKKVTPIAGSFVPGDAPCGLALETAEGTVTFGPLICFEDVFGYVARGMARAGADILVNFTNDGWFRSSPEPFQHAALSAFRAIETRRPLVRATNSGISTAIDRMGRITAVFDLHGRKTEVGGVMFATVALHPPEQTFYALYGDWLLVVWIAFAAVAVTRAVVRRRLLATLTQ